MRGSQTTVDALMENIEKLAQVHSGEHNWGASTMAMKGRFKFYVVYTTCQLSETFKDELLLKFKV